MLLCVMRVLGGLLFVLGAVGAGMALRASFERTRGAAALLGLAAPLAVLVAIAGLVLVFVPGFFG
jgi:hypothetical protein